MSHALIDTNHDGSIDIDELAGFLGCDEGVARDGVRGGGMGGAGGEGVRVYRGLGRRSRKKRRWMQVFFNSKVFFCAMKGLLVTV